jgi:hypothetical protein
VIALTKLDSLASVIRSKNASPFKVTLDIFFDEQSKFKKVKDSGILTKKYIAELYGIPDGLVEGIYFVDQALGIKITLIKEYPSDHFLSRDCYGAQQHLPLLKIEIPE